MSFLDSIKSGMKFLKDHIWHALVSVLGSQKAKDLTLAALQSAKELLATEFGQFVEKVVTELESSTLSGGERLSQATSNIKAYLEQQGQQMSTVWIQWAIHTILIFIRGAVTSPIPSTDSTPVNPAPTNA